MLLGMEELSEEEKVSESRGEVFTGCPGKYVALKNTIRGFKAIFEGQYDSSRYRLGRS